MPADARYLQDWFWRLARTRRVAEGGVPLPITAGEIRDFADLARLPIRGWEVEALRAMDDAALAQIRIEQKRIRNVM